MKIIRKHVKESRMLLNKSGIISVIEEESPPPPPKTVDKDPYNISNDEYYSTKTQESLIKARWLIIEFCAKLEPMYINRHVVTRPLWHLFLWKL